MCKLLFYLCFVVQGCKTKFFFETHICNLIFSNVVEKCVTHASRAERAMLIDEVCSSNDRYSS